MKIAIIAFGNVGRGFVELLKDRREALQTAYGFAPRITVIWEIYGAALDPEGLDLDREIVFRPPPVSLESAIADVDVVVELTPTNVETGGIGLTHCRMALQLGKHVVTTNKGPVVVAYRELAALAKAKGVQFRFEGAVMGGTPAMVFGLDTLAAAGVRSVRGIVNGTTNFMLTQMEAGESYAAVLKKAQELGYAEADPTGDVEGWDAAAKAVVLANTLLDGDLRIHDVAREGITGITPEMIAQAKAAGERWKLIAEVKRDGAQVTAAVSPQRLPVTDPLAFVAGSMNALTYQTDAIGGVTLVGVGAGGKATGFAILSDLLKIHQS